MKDFLQAPKAFIAEKIAPLTGKVSDAFARLSERERVIALGVTIWFSVMTLVFGTYFGIAGIDKAKKRVAFKSEQMREVLSMREVYKRAEEANNQFNSRLKRNDVRLVALVEEESKKLGFDTTNINPHDGETDPSGVRVQYIDMRAIKLTWDRVNKFIERVESNTNPVKVVKLKLIQRLDEKDLVDVEMTLATYKMAG